MEDRDAIEKFIAPDLETRKKRLQKIKDVSLYLVIGIICILVVFLVPLLSGCLKGAIGMNFPNTAEGWVLYWSINGGTTIGNVSLFVLFKEQAKINVKEDANYKKANEILNRHKEQKEFVPRSPRQMNTKEYVSKIFFIVVFSLCSFLTITSLAISFDFITFLSCMTSTVVALIFGWVTMIKNEEYWTGEYLEYAKWLDSKATKGENNGQI